MHYLVNDSNGNIVKAQNAKPTQEELQRVANFFECDIYVISGKRVGTVTQYETNEEPPYDRKAVSAECEYPQVG